MIFEWSRDLSIIDVILTDPRCYRRMKSDSAPERDAFKAVEGEYSTVICSDGGSLLGLFLVVPMSRESAEIHFCLLPHAWGRIEEIGRAFLAWLWKHSEYQLLIGPVPGYNRLALKAARSCGFTDAWVERDKLRKHGRAYDLIVTTISRAAACGSCGVGN